MNSISDDPLIDTEQARITEVKECGEVLDILQKFGHSEVDTARIYCDGTSEEYLGQLDLRARGIKIDTKLSPIKRFSTLAAGFKIRTYTHDPDELEPAILESLEALKVKQVEIISIALHALLKWMANQMQGQHMVPSRPR